MGDIRNPLTFHGANTLGSEPSHNMCACGDTRDDTIGDLSWTLIKLEDTNTGTCSMLFLEVAHELGVEPV